MIIATDLKFYNPNRSSGGIDLQQPEITKINAGLFPSPQFINANIKNVIYRKIFLFNGNQSFTLFEPILQIIEDNYSFFTLALEENGAPLPTDADNTNVDAGNGPGTFTVVPIALKNIAPNDFVAIWIRRFIFANMTETLNINFTIKVDGKSDG